MRNNNFFMWKQNNISRKKKIILKLAFKSNDFLKLAPWVVLLNIKAYIKNAKANHKVINWYKSKLFFELTHKIQIRVHFNNEVEWTLTKKCKLFSSHRTLSVLQENLLVKFSCQYHAPTKINFADNQHKFDSRNT